MPLYEYECGLCGEDFEELVSSSTSDHEVECPACEREGGAQRKLSAFAIRGGGSLGSMGSAAPSASGPSGFS